ncbi:MAG: PIN domain-containing protein [Candidatus Amoebophilus sp. 36-38]|nr:MAG: PIN domain-containing protein [Candidatus Amoebophilus sp. 36-38]
MKSICDTNVILRYLLADNPEMFAKTKAIFDQAKIGRITLIIEQTVFTEVIFVLSSFYKVPKDKITQILSELLAYKGISGEKEVLSLALDYYSKHNMHVVDCLLLAKNKITDLPILSFDQIK